MTLEERYTEVMKKFTAEELMELPDTVKAVIKKTTDLEEKVKIFEALAYILMK